MDGQGVNVINLIAEQDLSFNNMNSMIFIIEPLYNSDESINNFCIKSGNDCFKREFDNHFSNGISVNDIDVQLRELLTECIIKLRKGCKVTIDSINMFGKDYVIQCFEIKDGYLLCTLYKSEDISISQEVYAVSKDMKDTKVVEQDLREKLKRLQVQKEEAENANRVKSQFLANMCHELRIPMNSLVGTIQLLGTSNINEEQSKYIRIIKESADSLVKIINNILDISKIESGVVDLCHAPFDLRSTINDVYNNLLITGNYKGLEIGHYLDPNIDFQVIGDELKVKQVLGNLIDNAVKFTDNGYVSMRVHMVSSNENTEKIRFIVKDSGVGIEEGVKDKIFQHFIQGNLPTKKKHNGTGLGLAISKQLAKLMNGDIYFESKAGEGSTFIFTCEFKRVHSIKDDAHLVSHIQSNPDYSSANQDKVILCVEDNIINQEVMEDIITRKGYKCLSAYNGKDALNILNTNNVDLILMDIQLPELNGFDTAEIIRNKSEKGREIPIVAMTAYAMHEDRNKCIQAGMNDYIAKPFDLENLYSILEFHLGA
jgi:signal transduction histidine kinase/ActR/RegA family two-component response regulator